MLRTMRRAFHRYISRKKTRKNMSPLLNGAGNLVTKYMQKAVVLTAAFISAFTEKTYIQESKVLQTSGKA